MVRFIDAQVNGRRVYVTIAQPLDALLPKLVARVSVPSKKVKIPSKKVKIEVPLVMSGTPLLKGRLAGVQSCSALLPLEILVSSCEPVHVDIVDLDCGSVLTTMQISTILFEGPIGFVDILNSGSLHGWAWNPMQPLKRESIHILHHGSEVARVVANRFRRDLSDAGLGDGCHAFFHSYPGSLGALDELDFFIEGGHRIVVNAEVSQKVSPTKISIDADGEPLYQLRVVMPHATDRITLR
jgi:hypothetical protein